MERQRQIEFIEKNGLKAIGKKELLRHLYGERITRGESILAKCFDCMGYYIDGKADCLITTCPHYSFMPYRGKQGDD